MTDSDLATVRAIWRALDDEQVDAMLRFIAAAMRDAGVGDRRIRVRTLEAFGALAADPLPVPA